MKKVGSAEAQMHQIYNNLIYQYSDLVEY